MNRDVNSLAQRFKNKYFGTIAFRVIQHSSVVQQHLNPGERIYYVFCGQNGFSNKEIFSTCVVALTNERIIVATKRLLFGYDLTTVTPNLFNDLKVQSGLLFGKLIIDTAREKIIISNLAKSSLREVETAISTYIDKYKNNKKMGKPPVDKEEKKEEK